MQNEHASHQEGFLNSVNIQDITSSDTLLLYQASEIYDISLGQKYIPPEDLIKYADSPEKFVLLGSIANETLLGVMLAYPLDKETAEEYTKTFQHHDIPIALQEYNVGLIKSVAVKPEYRHQGIGTKLTLESMSRLKEMGSDFFLAVSWVSNRPDSSQKMFENLGFVNILSVSDYWTQDSIEKGYQCPNCGNPCHCTANFYFRKAD